MANFLQSSMDAYQRGFQQRYGPARRPGPMVVPVNRNPAIGAPLGANDGKDDAAFYNRNKHIYVPPPPVAAQPNNPQPQHPAYQGEVYPNLTLAPGQRYPTTWTPEPGTAESLQREEAQARAYESQLNTAENTAFTHGAFRIPNWFAAPLQQGKTAQQIVDELQAQRTQVPLEPGYRGSDYPFEYSPAQPSPLPGPTPVAANPAMGAPLGADDSSLDSAPQPQNQLSNNALTPQIQLMMLMPWLAAASGRGGAPIASNPEVGQPTSGDGSGASLFSLLFGNLFGGGNQQPNYQANVTTPESLASGGASGGGYMTSAPGIGQYYVGASPSPGISGDIYTGPNAQQTAAAAGDTGSGSGGIGGAMGGAGGAASSAISGIGSAISAFGKNVPNFQYNAPNVPLPQRAYFVPPTLSPNQNVSY